MIKNEKKIYKIEVKPNKVLKQEIKTGEIKGNNAFIICTSDENLNIEVEPKIVLTFDDITTTINTTVVNY